MPYVGVLAECCGSGVAIRVYRNPTHTDLSGNWSCFVPWHYERNLV